MEFNYLKGIDGDQSSKRLFSFILIILWVVYFFSNLYWGWVLKPTLEEFLFYMTCASFFTVLAERFAPKGKIPVEKKETTSTTTETETVKETKVP